MIAYSLDGTVATITMDDGKVNVLSPAALAALNSALDRAEQDAAVVVLSGRPGVFSAGFDLPTLRAGGGEGLAMLKAGFSTAARLLAFPTPVVVACTGHAIAMGVFLVLSGDYRVGADGPFKLTANEVAIGLTLPAAAIEICRQRLAPAQFNRAVLLAETFSPVDAAAAGFLDRVVPPDDVLAAAQGTAAELAGLDMQAHHATKRRVRSESLARIQASIDADLAA
ncbi:MAG TPA: crotonase/enoyl-CoA hydratase family protein [Acidimicrobiales bacterium]|nr:crotonase/enoyl-CoA hydratase family protein [Acidimicrobiales bacterium]